MMAWDGLYLTLRDGIFVLRLSMGIFVDTVGYGILTWGVFFVLSQSRIETIWVGYNQDVLCASCLTKILWGLYSLM